MKCELTLVLLLLCRLSDQCITYNFEEDFETMFSPESGICQPAVMNSWSLNNFTSLDMEAPHPLSTVFISPGNSQSCVSSFDFTMADGMLEIEVFMENVQFADFINTLVMNNNGGTVTSYFYNSLDENFKSGWNVIKIPTGVPAGFKGFIVLMGSASVGSVVLVDSFRYIPASMSGDDEECMIYRETVLPPTTADPNEATTESTDNNETTQGSGETDQPTTVPNNNEPTQDPGETGPPTTESDNNETTQGSGETGPPTTESDNNETTLSPGETGPPTTESDNNETTLGPGETDPTTESNNNETTLGPGETDPLTTESDSNETTLGPGETDPTTESDNSESTQASGTTDLPTTESDNNETTQDSGETEPPTTESSDNSETTIGPGEDIVNPPKPDDGFWNPLTIAMVTVISAIVLAFICMIFYQIGKKRAEEQIQPVIIPEVDYNNLPKSMMVPRVNTVYDVGVNPFRNSAL